nr:hypothetical protein [Tanacetum cinerariifolium]
MSIDTVKRHVGTHQDSSAHQVGQASNLPKKNMLEDVNIKLTHPPGAVTETKPTHPNPSFSTTKRTLLVKTKPYALVSVTETKPLTLLVVLLWWWLRQWCCGGDEPSVEISRLWRVTVVRVAAMGWRWRGVDGGNGGGCGGDFGVVAVRGGEWCGGSNRSEDGECFWGSPETLTGKVFRRRRWVRLVVENDGLGCVGLVSMTAPGGCVWFAFKPEMGVCFGGQPREGCVVVRWRGVNGGNGGGYGGDFGGGGGPGAPEVGVAAVASPARVLELDTHSLSEADPSESSPPPVFIAPMVLPFLCSDDSESDTEMLERHVSPTPHDDILTRALTVRKSVRPFPSHHLALRGLGNLFHQRIVLRRTLMPMIDIEADATAFEAVVDRDVKVEVEETGDIRYEAFGFSSMMLCMDFRLVVELVGSSSISVNQVPHYGLNVTD